MADQIFKFTSATGFMVWLAALLIVVRNRRSNEAKSISTFATGFGREDDKGRRVRRYDSDSKPVYE
jgi:hypothetical protein